FVYKSIFLNQKMSASKDNLLETFIKICDKVASVSSYISKSNVLQEFFQKGSSGKGFKGDIHLWVHTLLPMASQRVYNLQNKQIIKLFSRIFRTNEKDMLIDLEQGDVSETIRKYFESSKGISPSAKSTLTLAQVEETLINLTNSGKEDYQIDIFSKLCKKATPEDLKMLIRLIKQDLKINAKARHVLDAFGPDAYPAYQSSRDLDAVVDQFASKTAAKSPLKGKKTAGGSVNVQIMTPISPMLASACNSVDTAFKKNPGGLYSEIKYDGERVQIHKQGNEYRFFSRNLKPVMDHKVRRFKEIIPKAFPTASDMIIDSEIIMVDTDTGELLPFGTLGVHKKQEHTNSAVCLFIFDCIYFNGKDLQNVTFRERRKILEANLTPIKSYVQLSESHFLSTKQELALMTAKVLKAGMEGIVLKSPNGLYEPGKRKWLKVKKDYLFEGKMADTADLVVLGGWFGSGKKGGMLSIYLMGCLDKKTNLWKTVTKVHSGLDDATMEEIHDKLMPQMERSDFKNLPPWFVCNKPLVPDYIAKSPNKMPVWEITGAEFTSSNAHTANGISIRFPRITKLRNDKSPKEATSLHELQNLVTASKNNVNVDLLLKSCDDEADDIDIKTSMAGSPIKNVKVEKTKTSPKDRVSTPIKKDKPSLKRENSDEEDDDKSEIKKEKLDSSEEESKASPIKKGRPTVKRENSDECEDDFLPLKKQKKAGVFFGYTAYFQAEKGSKLRDYLKKFEEHGGSITLNKRKANIVLYEDEKFVETITQSRLNYSKDCRHITIQWMMDCMNDNVVKPIPEYAVSIKC
ncbi:DNA ligase 3, partial [Episyrphus balteatus]|uniref:DNA ligase 3 n=1 Tax=Episyrphus balteatus TaxID=286459 RepID=UPI0024856967